MTPEQAAWVREHVWTAAMRRLAAELPLYHHRCDCQDTVTGTCRNGDHNLCGRGAPLVRPVTHILRPGGEGIAYLPAPFEHPTPEAIGPRRTAAAQVWLAARRTCACQHGLTHWCQVGHCDRCHRGTPQPMWATVICGRDGLHPLYFAEPYEHETTVFATGPRRERLAMVWLADRVCRWVCPCRCHSAPPPPTQLDLFAEVA